MSAEEVIEKLFGIKPGVDNLTPFDYGEMKKAMKEYAKIESKSFAYWLTMPRKKTRLTMDQLYKEYEKTFLNDQR